MGLLGDYKNKSLVLIKHEVPVWNVTLGYNINLSGDIEVLNLCYQDNEQLIEVWTFEILQTTLLYLQSRVGRSGTITRRGGSWSQPQ